MWYSNVLIELFQTEKKLSQRCDICGQVSPLTEICFKSFLTLASCSSSNQIKSVRLLTSKFVGLRGEGYQAIC